MNKLVVLFLLLSPCAQASIIKASFNLLISDLSQSSRIDEAGAGHLILDTDNSELLHFHGESQNYSFSMESEPLMIEWDIHGIDGGAAWSYAYGGWGGKVRASRLQGAQRSDTYFLFQLFGGSISYAPEDGFESVFKNGDGFLNFWEEGGEFPIQSIYRISLEIAGCDISTVDPSQIPEPNVILLLVLGLTGYRISRRQAGPAA